MQEKQATVGAQSHVNTQASSNSVMFSQHEVWDEIDTSHRAMHNYDEALIKSEVDSPAMAASSAQAIAHHWRSMQQQDALRADQPCYLLELEASNGRYASILLSELNSILSTDEWRRFDPRYLLTDSRPERVSNCWQHPSLRYWIEQGNLEPVEFDPRQQRFIHLKSRRLILGLNSFVNPLTVIANGVFSGMRQTLYNIHYGTCFTAQVSRTVQNGDSQETAFSHDEKEFSEENKSLGDVEKDLSCADNVSTFTYDWHDIEDPCQHSQSSLIERYLDRLDSGLVLMPEQAFTVIQRLRDLADNGLLLLSCDRGFYSEQSLREQGMPQMGHCARYFLPLNGHAMSWYVDSLGGEAAHVQKSQDQALQSLIWCPSSGSTATANTRELLTFLANGSDPSVRRMAEIASLSQDSIKAEQLLALLEYSQFDYQILFAHLACLYESLPHLDAHQRIRWRDVLPKVWKRYYPYKQDAEFLISFGVLAMRLGAWSTAKGCLTYLANESPENLDGMYYLVACLTHLGERDNASRLVQKYLNKALDDDHMLFLSRQLHDWVVQCQQDPAYNPGLASDSELSLQPLASHYTEELLYQYRDPSIAVMTSLPDFDGVDQFEQWRQEQVGTKNQSIYALIHRDFGFIGVVSLRYHGKDGFFYFWIGADYQGQGFGQRAARLLFNMASLTLGLKNVYTAAFKDNSRSTAALLQLGLRPLPFKAKEPDDAYVFYTASRQSFDESHQSLKALLKHIESPIELLGLEMKDGLNG